MPDEPVAMTNEEHDLDRRLDAWGRSRVAAAAAPAGAGRAFVAAAGVRGRLVLARRVAWGSLAACVLFGVVLAMWLGTAPGGRKPGRQGTVAAGGKGPPMPTVIELSAMNREAEPRALSLAEAPAAPVRVVAPTPASELPRAGDRADHAVAKGF